jgi:hypothetical protein
MEKPEIIEMKTPDIEITEAFNAKKKRHEILKRVFDQNEIILKQNDKLVTMLAMIPVTITKEIDDNMV